jgi:hypothetical protein
MAEITKLSVGKVLDKLRRPDTPKPGVANIDEKTERLNEEIRLLRAARRHLASGKPMDPHQR